MSWSKGAVVVKYGDPEIAGGIENALISKRQSAIVDEKELKILERHKNLTKIHDTRFTDILIRDMALKYGPFEKPMPKWLDILLSPLTLVVYFVSLFADKYLTIKG